jgi:2-dehydropantoate 2-reductase
VKERGLELHSPAGRFTVRVPATGDPQAAGKADIVIQAVKLYDLEASSRAMAPMLEPRSVVVPIQNGVTARETIGALAGTARVAAGLVFINAHVESPGIVVSKSERNAFVMGGADLDAFCARCVQAGLDARLSADIEADLWRKFIPVAALSALACLSRQPIGPILASPALQRLYRQAMAEVAALGRAKGVRLEAEVVERMLAVAGTYQYDARVSMLEDLEAGRRLELEWLSGYVSREAARVGVPVPFHDIAYACLKPLAK